MADMAEQGFTPSEPFLEIRGRFEDERVSLEDEWRDRVAIAQGTHPNYDDLSQTERFGLAVRGAGATTERLEKDTAIWSRVSGTDPAQPLLVFKGSSDAPKIELMQAANVRYEVRARDSVGDLELPGAIDYMIRCLGVRTSWRSFGEYGQAVGYTGVVVSQPYPAEDMQGQADLGYGAVAPKTDPADGSMTSIALQGTKAEIEPVNLWEGVGRTLPIISSTGELQDFVAETPSLGGGVNLALTLAHLRSLALVSTRIEDIRVQDNLRGYSIDPRHYDDDYGDYERIPIEEGPYDLSDPDAVMNVGRLIFRDGE